jgi:hypothetical protein
VKKDLKTANARARALLKKLQALAERGIDGEKASAQRKIARLKARFDFSAPDPEETPDLFSGSFKRASTARRVYCFGGNELDVANAVKWAIESAAKIPCVYRGTELLAEASPATARKLTDIAEHITLSFRSLIGGFVAVSGVTTDDRNAFVMGLYDGMMNEVRSVGQRLPGGAHAKKTRGPKKKTVAHQPRLNIHPYTVALSLGKQIRFSVTLEQINAELEAAVRKHLAQGA